MADVIKKGSKYDAEIARNYNTRRSLEKAGANNLWTDPFKHAENAWEQLANDDIKSQREKDQVHQSNKSDRAKFVKRHGAQSK